jgi:hypothetical protein
MYASNARPHRKDQVVVVGSPAHWRGGQQRLLDLDLIILLLHCHHHHNHPSP